MLGAHGPGGRCALGALGPRRLVVGLRGLGFGIWVQGLGFWVFRSRVEGLGVGDWDFGFRV